MDQARKRDPKTGIKGVTLKQISKVTHNQVRNLNKGELKHPAPMEDIHSIPFLKNILFPQKEKRGKKPLAKMKMSTIHQLRSILPAMNLSIAGGTAPSLPITTYETTLCGT